MKLLQADKATNNNMEDNFPKKWVGGICIQENKVLLIHRINKERLFHQEYFVFPGRTVAEDESIEKALIKEFEEISLTVTLGELLYTHNDDEEEYYYFCSYILGELALPEIQEGEDQKQFYTPMWIPINELDELIIYPESVKELLQEKLLTEER